MTTPTLWHLPLSSSNNSNNLPVDDSSVSSSAFKVYDVKACADGRSDEDAAFSVRTSASDENRAASAADVAQACSRGGTDVSDYYYAKLAAAGKRCLAGDARGSVGDVGDVATSCEAAALTPLEKLAAHGGVTDSDEVINVCDVGTPSR